MRIVYHAANHLEAHMLKTILSMHAIEAYVSGEHLQGGMGTLPALDLVKLMVADEDHAEARAIIEQWQAAGEAPGKD